MRQFGRQEWAKQHDGEGEQRDQLPGHRHRNVEVAGQSGQQAHDQVFSGDDDKSGDSNDQDGQARPCKGCGSGSRGGVSV